MDSRQVIQVSLVPAKVIVGGFLVSSDEAIAVKSVEMDPEATVTDVLLSVFARYIRRRAFSVPLQEQGWARLSFPVTRAGKEDIPLIEVNATTLGMADILVREGMFKPTVRELVAKAERILFRLCDSRKYPEPKHRVREV